MFETKNLSVFGPYQDPTGYSHVVRGFTKELYNRGYTVSISDFPEWSGRTIEVDDLYHHMANNSKVTRSDTLLAFCLPEQLKHPSCPQNGQITLNYTMFEADGICKDWVNWSSMTDYVIVPTEFNRQGWIKSGVNPNRVFVVPIGVDSDFYNKNISPLPLFKQDCPIDQYKHRFLNIQEVSERKNLDTLLKSWIEATQGVEDSCLVLKLASYSENRLDFFGKRLERIRKELNIKKGEHAPIYVYSAMLTDLEIAQLMNNFTHYISTSRGEGWDMNAAAFAVMGKQLIVPEHSAYKEYLEHAHFIKSTPTSAQQKSALNRLYEGLNWFEVDYKDLVGSIKECLLNNKTHESNRSHMEDNYSWEEATNKLEKVIDIAKGNTPRVQKIFTQEKSKENKEKDVIMFGCKSYGTQCGIAEYSVSLTDAILKTIPDVALGRMGGEDVTWMDHIDNNGGDILHVQHEYQFHMPQRLSLLFREASQRNVKTIITQHTLNRDAEDHNKIIREHADLVLVHSQYAKKYAEDALQYKNVEVVPMGIGKTLSVDPELTSKALGHIKPNKTKIGFFGFSYYHKGIDIIIDMMGEMSSDCHFVILSSKPKQDAIDYHGQCRNILKNKGFVEGVDYTWFDGYLPIEQSVQILSQCDVNVLPYREYGGVGTSAAISTVLQARVPTVVTDTCWFKHVPGVSDISDLGNGVVYKVRNLDWFQRDVEAVISSLQVGDESLRDIWSDNIREYINRNTWEEAAKRHQEIYKEILHNKKGHRKPMIRYS